MTTVSLKTKIVFSSSDSAYENIIGLSIIYKVTETKSDGSKETHYKDYSYAAGVKKMAV